MKNKNIISFAAGFAVCAALNYAGGHAALVFWAVIGAWVFKAALPAILDRLKSKRLSRMTANIHQAEFKVHRHRDQKPPEPGIAARPRPCAHTPLAAAAPSAQDTPLLADLTSALKNFGMAPRQARTTAAQAIAQAPAADLPELVKLAVGGRANAS